jgi:hypothetical protein
LRSQHFLAGLLESAKHINFGIQCQYLKFAISRSLIQRFQSNHSGGMLSAIGVLEVTSVQDEVSKLHRSCLRSLRSFWNAAAHERDVEHLNGFLEEFLNQFQQADFIMKDMLVKYPNSVVFLRAYGSFMRDICQDRVKANELFNKAENLENASEGIDDAGASRSMSSSAFRNAAANAWTQLALQKDIDMMDNVSKSMRNTLGVLVAVSTAVYCILEFILLQSASGHISDIFALNSARSECETAIYSARDATLAAFRNDSDSFANSMSNLASSAAVIKAFISESHFTDDTLQFFFFSELLVLRPQLVGISLPDQVSPAAGLQQFADACIVFAAASMQQVSHMVRTNDFSGSAGYALRFLLINGDSPVIPSLNNGGMLLQGQAVSFVYLSGVFYVVAGLIVVLLGLYMVVLARRLLSEAIVLLRTSTICISSSLHISQTSRKCLSEHYKRLEQEAMHMTGEAVEAADGGEAMYVDQAGSDSDESTAASDEQQISLAHQKIPDAEMSDVQLPQAVFLSSGPNAAHDAEASDTLSHDVQSWKNASDTPCIAVTLDENAQDAITGLNAELQVDSKPEALPLHLSPRPAGKTFSTKFAAETSRIPDVQFASSGAHSDSCASEASQQSLQGNNRDRKMLIIVCLCVLAVVCFNVSCYLYLNSVQIGSKNFSDLRKLLSIQADIDFPLARVLPTLLHVAQLSNPFLTGQSRMTQLEHTNMLKVEFKLYLEKWQDVYSDRPSLSVSLRRQLAAGLEM